MKKLKKLLGYRNDETDKIEGIHGIPEDILIAAFANNLSETPLRRDVFVGAFIYPIKRLGLLSFHNHIRRIYQNEFGVDDYPEMNTGNLDSNSIALNKKFDENIIIFTTETNRRGSLFYANLMNSIFSSKLSLQGSKNVVVPINDCAELSVTSKCFNPFYRIYLLLLVFDASPYCDWWNGEKLKLFELQFEFHKSLSGIDDIYDLTTSFTILKRLKGYIHNYVEEDYRQELGKIALTCQLSKYYPMNRKDEAYFKKIFSEWLNSIIL